MDGLFLCNTPIVLGILLEQGEFHTTASIAAFLMFIFIAGYTIMNMLVGIICEVVSKVAVNQMEESDIKVMKQTILVELKRHDDGDGLIDEDEMNELMADPETVRVLESLNIDVPFLQEIQVMTYREPGVGLPIDQLIDQMLACRCGLKMSVKQMIMQTKLVHWTLENHMKQLEQQMDVLRNDMGSLLDGRNAKLLQDTRSVLSKRILASGPVSNMDSLESSRPETPTSPTLFANRSGKAVWRLQGRVKSKDEIDNMLGWQSRLTSKDDMDDMLGLQGRLKSKDDMDDMLS